MTPLPGVRRLAAVGAAFAVVMSGQFAAPPASAAQLKVFNTPGSYSIYTRFGTKVELTIIGGGGGGGASGSAGVTMPITGGGGGSGGGGGALTCTYYTLSNETLSLFVGGGGAGGTPKGGDYSDGNPGKPGSRSFVSSNFDRKLDLSAFGGQGGGGGTRAVGDKKGETGAAGAGGTGQGLGSCTVVPGQSGAVRQSGELHGKPGRPGIALPSACPSAGIGGAGANYTVYGRSVSGAEGKSGCIIASVG
ncbi:glycine-rich domain-containing protein [Streptomyces huiliensis]|uniref:glycine-rich domain-containing protein n=1 Tax=Streptomyces huiliensis TaxID=2876027 RepID=UPI001CBD4589|nr:hypothetical protein [Streptomyces huiliensis]MBZ4318539.1 hypothetical protein [Streptomyces huiliensis]